jgi:sortase (surface protein transpeptidase)
MSRRQAATGLAAGLAMMLSAPVVWWVAQPDPAGQTVTSVNAAAAAELASPSVLGSASGPAPTGSAAPGSSVAQSRTAQSAAAQSSAAQPTEQRSSAAPAGPAPKPSQQTTPKPAPKPAAKPTPPAAPPVKAPVSVEIPSLGVQAPVIPMGVDSEGVMEIPEDVSDVGWYRFGPAPGAPAGSAVLTGHVDDYKQGVGVFGRIGDMNPGDIVKVTDEGGVTREFTVVAREEWPKAEVPLDRLFDRGGESRLVLITCGGSFNESTLGYDDNIAITAIPTKG